MHLIGFQKNRFIKKIRFKKIQPKIKILHHLLIKQSAFDHWKLKKLNVCKYICNSLLLLLICTKNKANNKHICDLVSSWHV